MRSAALLRQPVRFDCFQSAGYAAMRSGWDVNAHQMIVDVGPLGCPISSGHGHADLLSVQCVAFGEPILIDAGTGSYTGDGQWRDYFRSTAAHSTLRVDKRDHAQPAGLFAWHSRPRATLLEWHSDTLFDVIHAEHDAYSDISVTCRRRAIFVKPHYWLLIDDVDGSAPHQVEVAFQFAPMRVRRGRTRGSVQKHREGGPFGSRHLPPRRCTRTWRAASSTRFVAGHPPTTAGVSRHRG
jgi:hypothetical protein